MQIFNEAYSDTVIDFTLYHEHFTFESCYVEHLMNYYGIAYKKVFL